MGISDKFSKLGDTIGDGAGDVDAGIEKVTSSTSSTSSTSKAKNASSNPLGRVKDAAANRSGGADRPRSGIDGAASGRNKVSRNRATGHVHESAKTAKEAVDEAAK
jgi:hypothetical protein